MNATPFCAIEIPGVHKDHPLNKFLQNMPEWMGPDAAETDPRGACFINLIFNKISGGVTASGRCDRLRNGLRDSKSQLGVSIMAFQSNMTLESATLSLAVSSYAPELVKVGEAEASAKVFSAVVKSELAEERAAERESDELFSDYYTGRRQTWTPTRDNVIVTVPDKPKTVLHGIRHMKSY